MPTVSVIMPAFNAARFIERAIRSVQRQTTADLELIVIDDGSSDETAAVVRDIAGLDQRVRLLTQNNAGPGPARNTGFRAATGRFFAFLDSDDEWAPTFLEAQLAILDRRPEVHVVFGNAWNRGGARDGQPARPLRGAHNPISLADILADDNLHFIMAVFRREVVDATGGFDPSFLTNEEYEMWLRAGLAGFRFTRNPEPLGWYSCRPDSLSASDTRMLAGALRVLKKIRPRLPPGSREIAILDRQAAQWEQELSAAHAREALARGDRSAAARELAALETRRGGWLLGIAARLPIAAVALYRLRRVLRQMATSGTRWRSTLRASIDRFDRYISRAMHTRRVLIYVRTAMHAGVLDPVACVLERDRRLDVRYLCENDRLKSHVARACGRPLRWISRRRAAWSRIDLLVTADPWSPPTLHRCHRRINFFHGVAGKYDLDSPGHLPIGFDEYDRVAFVNADRMHRYLRQGIVRREAAVLVGFPKLDALVNGRYEGAAVRDRLGLEMHRPTAIYAPTWSPASSLHLAGEAIVASLVDAGWNVIVKPHARSFELDEKYSGGIDWRQRLHRIEAPGRVVLCDDGDASPLLAASDLMVTDHSTIGFEFCLLDRPLVVFDAPELPTVARINPERVAALRSAARVVSRAEDVGRAANEEIARPGRLRAARQAAARPLFFEPGNATERALDLVYQVVDLPAYHLRDLPGRAHIVGASL